jgi:hypothetical protein
MTESKLEHTAVSITAAAFVFLVGILFPFSSVIAEPIDLNGSIPLGTGSISGALHGDLTKNTLTLNKLPISKISIDTTASGPLPPSTLPGSFTYTQGFLVELPFGNTNSVSYNVEFTITPHLSASLVVPTWHFGVSGKANLGSGTARLMAVPQSPSTIGTINAISTPTFSGRITTSLDPVTTALAQAALNVTLTELNSSGAKLSLNFTGEWEKLSIGPATMTLTRTMPNIKIDLNLTSAILMGRFDYKVDLSFTSPTNGFVGSIFEEDIEGLIEDELMNRLLSYVDHEFDREVNGKLGGYRQNCSGQQLGPTRIGTSCNINTQLALTPNLEFHK